MAIYQIDIFDGVDLPLYNPEQDLGAANVPSQLLDVIGGATVDYPGSQRWLGTRQPIKVRGFYFGQIDYLVDETDNPIVDELGNRIITGTVLQSLNSQYSALVERLGRRGNLERKRWDNETVRHWRLARLLAVGQMHDYSHRNSMAEIEAAFETGQSAWRSETGITSSGSRASGGPISLTIPNSGQLTVDDAILTITATATVSTIRVICLDTDSDWSWAGTLSAGNSLVVDCGAQTILNNGADAYSGFTRNSAHTANGWLPLEQGMNSVTITVNAAAAVSLVHYDQWL